MCCGVVAVVVKGFYFLVVVVIMGFNFGMGIDSGSGGCWLLDFDVLVVAIVKNWCLWLSFGGRWVVWVY